MFTGSSRGVLRGAKHSCDDGSGHSTATVQRRRADVKIVFVAQKCRRDPAQDCAKKFALIRYLDYLNKVAPKNQPLKTEDFPDQKRAPWTPNSSIYNRNPFSQAGRRGFESRLPLHFPPCPARRHG